MTRSSKAVGPSTLHEAFAATAETAPTRDALWNGQVWVTYGAVHRQLDALARGLADLGLRPGERVGLVLPQGAQAMVAFFAVLQAGGAAALLNPFLREREFTAVLEDLRPSIVVAANRVPGNELEDSLRVIRERLHGLREVVLLERSLTFDAPTLDAVIAAGVPARDGAPPTIHADEVAAILYTTGTTGTPRGVMHSHASLLGSYRILQRLYDSFLGGAELKSAARLTAAVWRYRRRMLRGLGERTWMTPLSAYSIAGFRVLLQAMLSGQRALPMERFHPRLALELIEQQHVSILAASPAMVEAMTSVSDFDSHDLSSLLVVGLGSAPASPDLVRRARARFGCPVLNGYGTTETGGGVLVTQMHDSAHHQEESVGLPFPGAEVKIVDGERRELPPGRQGELACRVSSLMVGYSGAEDRSAPIDADGWYYTGDLAVRDNDGYVRILGRKRDVVIRGGHNVVPLEVERVLEEHPAVSRAAVVGIPDRGAGERIVAFAVLDPSLSARPADLRLYCAGRLAAYKLPDQIRIVLELPLAPSGEVRKAALRALALAAGELPSVVPERQADDQPDA
jgi:fatty-acyl-CoA synthase